MPRITYAPQRNAGIDLLRGLSILLVITHHVGLRLPLAKGVLGGVVPRWLLTLANWRGYHAVFIFFVISGFLIAGNALERWGALRQIDLAVFYRRRASRILPLFLLLLAVLSLLHLLNLRDYAIHAPGQSLGHALFAALGLHLNWYEGLTGYLPANWDVLWSLSIEECFYLGFPLVCLLVRWEAVLGVLLTGLALALPYFTTHTAGSDVWQEKAYLPGFSAIALGVVGALVARWQPPRWLMLTVTGIGVVGMVAGLCGLAWLYPLIGEGTLLVLTLGTVLLLIGFQWQARAKKPWRLRAVAWIGHLGMLSYEIYLTHMFIVLSAVRLWQIRGLGLSWALVLYPPVVLACWGLGWAVERWISKPAERWLRG